MNLKLTKTEKQVLFRKYKSEGADNWAAEERVKKVDEEMKQLVLKLRQKKLSEEQINIRFKQKFEELCMRLG